MKTETGTQSDAPGRESGWADMAFDALDMAAVMFSDDLTLRVANATWRMRFDPDIAPGTDAAGVVQALTDRAPGKRVEGFSGRDLIGLIKSCVRDYELPRQGVDPLLLTSTPVRDGGYLVTLRDPDRGRVVEARALEMLRASIESVDMGMIVWDSGLIVRLANDGWNRHVAPAAPGESVKAVGQRILERGFYEPRHAMSSEETLTAVIMESHRHRRRWELRHNDGRHVRLSTFPMQSGGVLAVAFDVSERRDVEAQARHLVADALDSIGDGVLLVDAHLNSLMVNRAYLAMFHDPNNPPEIGASATELVRRSIENGRTLVPEGMGAEALVDQIRESILACDANVATRHPDGKVVERTSYPTAMGGYVIVFRDVTARRAAEQAEREADELVRTIVDASPSTFLVSRLEDGKVIYAPQLSRERFGDIDSTLSFFLDPADRQRYIEALQETGSLTDYRVRFRRRNGSIMDGLTSARVIQFRGEQLIVSATRDITDQLAMQSELERQRELAHQNEKLSALGGLLAGVAHELNNPLSIVVANAMMLEEDLHDPKLRRRVERLAAAAKRSGRIVKTFLAMARNRPMRTETVEINEVINAAVEISSYGLHAANVEIVLELDAGNPAVEVDADQIIQVLSNLLINAEQALQDKTSEGRVTLMTRVQGDKVAVIIRDNGPGVPKELHRRIFEPYFTTKEVGEGTGVGLAFCHRLVTAHGGQIDVRDAKGGGAEFRVTLPAACCPSDEDQEEVGTRPQTRAHVLVLDDEPDVAVTVSDVISRGGYRVTVAGSAEEALARCAETWFDAILSDVRMPGIDGVEFFDELRRRDPDQAARIAFMTGDAMGQDSGGGVSGIGCSYLEKPAEPTEILALVAQLIAEASDGG